MSYTPKNGELVLATVRIWNNDPDVDGDIEATSPNGAGFGEPFCLRPDDIVGPAPKPEPKHGEVWIGEDGRAGRKSTVRSRDFVSTDGYSRPLYDFKPARLLIGEDGKVVEED